MLVKENEVKETKKAKLSKGKLFSFVKRLKEIALNSTTTSESSAKRHAIRKNEREVKEVKALKVQ